MRKITKFADLLKAAREQQDPQRLLFLFAKAEIEDKGKKKKKNKGSEQGGTIDPVMTAFKLPEEIESFEALVKEADQMSPNWNFVFIAALSGFNGQPPSEELAETHLNQMVGKLMMGEDMSRYVILDRDENPIYMSAD